VNHGFGRNGGREIGRDPVDEHVDVRSKARSGLDEAIAQARNAPVEALEEPGDGLAVDVVAALGTREQRQ
jgi:hypothetical protein